ncbi:hypothetical protein BDN70DRAFT_946497 [Pholiota conissans]|uniref:Uncharacterized protein n=1 Tax=Pholiota conissans TaxID=109636 RepID=A0A9P6CZG5_9AGAR|nr:hypothetical protein BDN70DRAFT_946497 [Pholiota conissans]
MYVSTTMWCEKRNATSVNFTQSYVCLSVGIGGIIEYRKRDDSKVFSLHGLYWSETMHQDHLLATVGENQTCLNGMMGRYTNVYLQLRIYFLVYRRGLACNADEEIVEFDANIAPLIVAADVEDRLEKWGFFIIFIEEARFFDLLILETVVAHANRLLAHVHT